jgi:flagellar hook-basal body complex protein FliE
MPAIDPSMAVNGLEWQVPGIGPTEQVEPQQPAEGAFDGVLTNQLSNLTDMQSKAAEASQSLADGTATDPTSVVMEIERARLAMQLASQIRTKAVESIQDVFHTQV